MKFRCEREVLANALSTAGRATSSRANTPALSGLRLSLTGNELQILGSDLEMSIELTITVGGEQDGAALVPARLIADIVKALPAGAVQVDVRDDEMTISAGRSEFAIRTLNLTDYPDVNIPDGQAVSLTSEQMAEALRQVVRAASTDEARQVLTGVLIAAEDDGVRMVATDSYRLAVRNLPESDILEGRQKVLIPGRALGELQRLVSSDADLNVTLGARDAVFRSGGTCLTTRLIEGDYPNYANLIPPPPQNVLTIERAALLEALRRVKILAQDMTPVRLQLSPSEVVLRAVTQDVGDAHESLDGTYAGEEMTIAFNPEYLSSGVDALDTEEIRLEIQAPMKPALIRGVGRDDYLYLLMPVRVP